MGVVRIAEKRVWVDHESRALLSGEIHFWRLDPSVWPAVLDRTRELGLEIVSSYVCWDFHELVPGAFDFTGRTNPRCDLLGFIELVRERGFWLLLRPGPYIYAEWPNSGIPERMVQWHRLHAHFQDEARVWMRAVVDAVRAYLGNPIVLVQADNEADPWADVYGSQLGLGDSPGLFQVFLRERYGDMAHLNAAWGTDYADFADCRAFQSRQLFPARYVDVVRFRHWYATASVRWTADEYRRLGVDVPIYANTYIDTAVQAGRSSEAACDLAGPDIYPSSRLAESTDEHRGVLESVRYAHSFSRLPFIPEFESGIWHGWHAHVGTLTATNYELNAYTALAAGAAGWNWYMLAARDSWYMSPITELGRFRPELAPAFAEIVRVFREIDPPSLTRLTETAVTFNAAERGAYLGNADVLRALYAADIDYEFLDVDADSGWYAKPLVVYAGGEHLTADQRQRLHDYVQQGGQLVLFQPLSMGLGAAPIAVTSASAPHRIRLEIGGGVELSSPAAFVYADPPGEPIVAERIEPLPSGQEGGHAHLRLPVGERLVVGYVERQGAGRLVTLGVSPTPELMLALHAWLGVRIPCLAPVGSRIQSALFQGDDAHVLILTNTADHAADVRLRLDVVERSVTSARDVRTGFEAVVSHAGVTLRVPARSGTAVQLR